MIPSSPKNQKQLSINTFQLQKETKLSARDLATVRGEKSTSFLSRLSKSSKHLGNDKFKFFQGDHAIFTKDFEDDHSKLFIDQSASMQMLSNSDQERLDDETDCISNPKIAQLLEINKILDELVIELNNPDRELLLDKLEQLANGAKEAKDNFLILLKCMELQGKILRDLGDYGKAVGVFKQMRIYCNIGKIPQKKLAVYRLIVDTYIQMREYNHAITFAKKMLRLSWVLNDPDFEIIAYDKIGLLFYYNGDLIQADFFHEKACQNDREPKTSAIRKVGEALSLKVKKGRTYPQNNYETDSEDEFELGMFSNSYASSRRYDDENQSNNTQSLPSLKHRIPVPRKVNEYIRKMKELGRVDISVAKKQSFSEGEQETKFIYNQLSLNRNLKNFMIQQYVNHQYWAGSHNYLSKIKFYHLHRNIKNHLSLINRIKKMIKQQKRIFKVENLLGNQQLLNSEPFQVPLLNSSVQTYTKDMTTPSSNSLKNITEFKSHINSQAVLISTKKNSVIQLPSLHSKIQTLSNHPQQKQLPSTNSRCDSLPRLH